MKAIEYKTFGNQPYIISMKFSVKQSRLLFSLRSNCYSAKMNFSKINQGNLNCIFLCNQQETKINIFEECQPIRDRLDCNTNVKLKYIYGTLDDQIEAIIILEKIEIWDHTWDITYYLEDLKHCCNYICAIVNLLIKIWIFMFAS